MLRRLLVGGAMAVVALAAAAGAGWLYYLNFSPDRSRFPVRGIDVSHHQGAIDWTEVAEANVAFAVIKASEGGDYVDEEFAGNFAAARAAGLAVGAYHFFTFCRPGAEQATNFLAQVPLTVPQLPPAVDIEFGGNCSRRPTAEELRTELDAFLGPVEAAFGRPRHHLPDRRGGGPLRRGGAGAAGMGALAGVAARLRRLAVVAVPPERTRQRHRRRRRPQRAWRRGGGACLA